MNVCSSTLEKNYEGLRAKVAVRAARLGFIRPDFEDILHDVCLEILEESILDPADYCSIVSRVISRYRSRHYRSLERRI